MDVLQVARPLLRAHEFGQYETVIAARLMRFETVHVIISVVERNLVRFAFSIQYTRASHS